MYDQLRLPDYETPVYRLGSGEPYATLLSWNFKRHDPNAHALQEELEILLGSGRSVSLTTGISLTDPKDIVTIETQSPSVVLDQISNALQ